MRVAFRHKNLVPPHFQHPQWPKREGKKAMTIVTGIICADAIVLAADSQFTDPSNGVVSFGDKISTVEFKQGNHVLVAQAGLPAITKHIVELVSEKSKEVAITSALTVTEIVLDSICRLRERSTQEQWAYGKENGGASLMVAFYANNKPCLYTVNVYGHGIMSEPENSHFAVAGAGAPLAEYLLSQIAPRGAFHNVALATTIFVIGKVKDHQKGACGGDTMIQILFPVERPGCENSHIGKSEIINQRTINNMEKLLIQQDKNENKPRKMLLMLEDYAKKLDKILENKGENKS
jgi:20S proteasome alpha/beta subunit